MLHVASHNNEQIIGTWFSGDNINYTKDFILMLLLVSALTGFFYAYRQKQSTSQHLNRMMKDMEGLQKAELDLKNLQVMEIFCVVKIYFENNRSN